MSWVSWNPNFSQLLYGRGLEFLHFVQLGWASDRLSRFRNFPLQTGAFQVRVSSERRAVPKAHGQAHSECVVRVERKRTANASCFERKRLEGGRAHGQSRKIDQNQHNQQSTLFSRSKSKPSRRWWAMRLSRRSQKRRDSSRIRREHRTPQGVFPHPLIPAPSIQHPSCCTRLRQSLITRAPGRG
jgi:hypothetical protein